MKKYTIFSDYHIGHPYALKPNFSFSENTVFLGDNFDIKNALKKDLDKITRLKKETIDNCKKGNGIILYGNHSLEPITNRSGLFAIRDNVLFTHGDIIQWGSKRTHFYRTFYSPGKSKFYWVLLKWWRNLFPGNITKLSKKQIRRAVKLAKQNKCKTIVMGHFHPSKGIIDLKEEGIRIVVVQRGKAVIRL